MNNKIFCILALLLTILIGSNAKADDVWITASIASYHTDRSKNYNEDNLGIGIEYGISKNWKLAAGGYKNSVYTHSTYFGAIYAPIILGPVRIGAAVGFVDGYKSFGSSDKYSLIAVPVASIEGKRFGANIIAAPPIRDNSGVIGLQLKVKF